MPHPFTLGAVSALAGSLGTAPGVAADEVSRDHALFSSPAFRVAGEAFATA